VKNCKKGTRGTVCIKKNIKKSSNFLIQGKNMKYIQGLRGDQDGDPSHGLPNDFGELPQQSDKAAPGHWQTATTTHQRAFGQQHAH
jgi:hypothetical protein